MPRVLASIASRLNRAAGQPAIPALYFVTDGARTPDPVALAARLPRGAAIIYRHFGAADRQEVAEALAAISRRRGLVLLIGGDVALARAVRAHGVHLPEREAHRGRRLKAAGWLVTAAAHSGRALLRARAADAVFLSPVLPSRSASARGSLGPLRAGRLARLARNPVIALGGVNVRTARRLIGRGFAGIAAVDGLTEES